MTAARTRSPLALAAAAAAGFVVVAFGYMLFDAWRSRPPPCEGPVGLRLVFDRDKALLTGRAPAPVLPIAFETANTHWGLPEARVCRDPSAFYDSAWEPAIEAALGAPIGALRNGDVFVRPDTVVIAGEAESEAKRAEVLEALDKRLAKADRAKLALVVRITVRPPPAPVAPAGSVATAPPAAAALALPAPSAERTPLVNRVAEARILFDSGDAVLTPDAAAVVNALAPELAASGRTIVIVGHADASGPAGLNDYLSRERAEAVKEALVARGVPAGRIRAFGVGSGVPATEQDTDAGRTASRRVEMYLR